MSQLDLLDLIAEASREAPAPCLFGSPARGLPARAAEFEAWCEEYDHFGSLPRSHAWTRSITHPRNPTEQCRPSCLSADVRCNSTRHRWDRGEGVPCYCVGALVYRGACRGCDWEGDPRGRENEAVEDAHDHAWPGWRGLPVIRTRKPGAPHQAARWADEVALAYPPGWIEAGGPVRILRTPPGMRHVPSMGSPFGGYDMATLEGVR
jgi:hypothetical protein